ncbi:MULTISPECIES: hypothetical protein [unclassified Pseudomonas]|uniref:hypothetical protein n=1 Tax=unclassified Pseudomonas TaxID=196821 RepID=UPI000876E6D1|nr:MULTISPECIES: hypothetical protein [unclassified Pseudomonas]SCZ27860.1 hypothetical protein SAMN03159405_01921 [Pseudomonas sp. NFACC44-2]SDA75565.1 hypothetical protein SAMN03159429_03542 [Pseudomonas sp. NFACC51]SEJ31160.1 hypothetical protein SAMN03159298_02759 [Pseudomonas sp. NFACC07-1]SFH43561.1 hypothetical protein SAMN03159302_01536 [Pseudomonas sp. NFACC54]SFT15410.1 hypothetical protein SAMN03159306_04068 [Pseudomonas sp. NFACC48-1]
MVLSTALLMMFIYLAFRNKSALGPSNIVFLNYALYFIFPAVLFYFLEALHWEYVLPWGKMNDWSALSEGAVLSYLYVFIMFFIFTRLLEIGMCRTVNVNFFESYAVRSMPFFLFISLIFFGGVIFIQVTGGVDQWLGSYSDTYLKNKKGYGLLNFLLIVGSNFLAFVLGFYWRVEKRVNWMLVFYALTVLVFCAYLQGIKSRVFYYAVFFSVPWLVYARVSISKGVAVFVAFMVAFMFSMYFRSNGFYSTPEMLLEYFLSYFNTIFLHDRIIHDMDPQFFKTIGFPVNKWLTFVGVPSEDYLHDISRWLTSIYFPAQWFEGAATQQWPIETELYLNYGYFVFWVVPVFFYSLFMCFLYSARFKFGPVFLFIYVLGYLHFLSVFRGSMLAWIDLFSLLVYIFLLVLGRAIFVRVSHNCD